MWATFQSLSQAVNVKIGLTNTRTNMTSVRLAITIAAVIFILIRLMPRRESGVIPPIPKFDGSFVLKSKVSYFLPRESELEVGRGSESSLFLNQGLARTNQKFAQISEVRELLN